MLASSWFASSPSDTLRCERDLAAGKRREKALRRTLSSEAQSRIAAHDSMAWSAGLCKALSGNETKLGECTRSRARHDGAGGHRGTRFVRWRRRRSRAARVGGQQARLAEGSRSTLAVRAWDA